MARLSRIGNLLNDMVYAPYRFHNPLADNKRRVMSPAERLEKNIFIGVQIAACAVTLAVTLPIVKVGLGTLAIFAAAATVSCTISLELVHARGKRYHLDKAEDRVRFNKMFGADYPDIAEKIQLMAQRFGFRKTPAITVRNAKSALAFATWSPLRGHRVNINADTFANYRKTAPSGTAERQVLTIVAHEFTHVRRNDCIKSVCRALCTLTTGVTMATTAAVAAPTLLTCMLLPACAAVLFYAERKISRYTERRADRTAVMETGYAVESMLDSGSPKFTAPVWAPDTSLARTIAQHARRTHPLTDETRQYMVNFAAQNYDYCTAVAADFSKAVATSGLCKEAADYIYTHQTERPYIGKLRPTRLQAAHNRTN